MKNSKTKIYIANVDCLKDRALFEKLCSSVSQKRREKIDKYRFDEDKRLSLGAEALFIKALDEFGIDYKSINLDYGKNKKPYIKGNELYFNLSHSGNMAVCAVSESEIGVDIEQIKSADFKIAKRIFTESETAFVGDSNEQFIRLWTLKESYMKYLGKGLSLSPKDIEIDFVDNVPKHKGVSFFEYAVDGCRLSLCGGENVTDTATQTVNLCAVFH